MCKHEVLAAYFDYTILSNPRARYKTLLTTTSADKNAVIFNCRSGFAISSEAKSLDIFIYSSVFLSYLSLALKNNKFVQDLNIETNKYYK